MELAVELEKVGIALGLGLLVGMQRQRAASKLAGIRTFPLITVFGTLAASLADEYGGGVLAAAGLAIGALLVLGNIAKIRGGETALGLTTEVAALVMFGVGAYLVHGHNEIAIALAGVLVLLLHWKRPLHTFVERVGKHDFQAIMQFVLVALVILPVLPDETYDPFDVLNPREIWLMVVLIVGISLAGYVSYKVLQHSVSLVLSGVLGGVISSTATTVSYARRSVGSSTLAPAVVLMIASAISVLRVMIELAIVSPRFVQQTLPPFAVLLLTTSALSAVVFWAARSRTGNMEEQTNPAQLKTAMLFAVLYATVLFASAVLRDRFGNNALYALAAVSGLVDLNAITLSTARLMQLGRVDPALGYQVVMLATAANLVFKLGVVAFLGSRRLLWQMTLLFGLSLAAAVALFWFWPVSEWPSGEQPETSVRQPDVRPTGEASSNP